MRRAVLIAILVVACLPSVVWSADREPVPPPPPQDPARAPRRESDAVRRPASTLRLMTLGDSITRGVVVSAEGDSPLLGGYRTRLWQRLVNDGRVVDMVGTQSSGPDQLPDRDHEGHNGWRIDQLRAELDSWVPRYHPDIVLVLAGTNDVYWADNLQIAPNRLVHLLDTIHTYAPAAHIMVGTIPPMWGSRNTDVQAFNAEVRRIIPPRTASGVRETLVDINAVLNDALLADGVHPNPDGYTAMADAWYGAITPLVTRGCTPRPPIGMTVTRTAWGQLITVTPGYGVFTDLRFDRVSNASAYLRIGQPDTATIELTQLGPGPFSLAFTTVDGCGNWQTFAGSGR